MKTNIDRYLRAMNLMRRYSADFRLNLHLAFPIMLGQLGQVMVNLADNLMVGRLGAGALAAVSIANSIFVVFVVIGMGLSFALPPLISQADGAQESYKIPTLFKHSLSVNVFFGLLTLILIYSLMPLLDHMGQDPSVVPLAKEYLEFTAWSILPMMIFLTQRSYADGLSKTIPAMIAMILGNILNVILNYGFIFGKLGMPNLGVEGAALASLIARAFMVLFLLYLLYKDKGLWNHLQKIKIWTYQISSFKQLLRLGIPSSLQMFFEVSAFSAAALIAGMVSKEVQAAHQIAINLASITFLICTGIGMASTIRVGRQLGQRDYVSMKNAGVSAIVQVGIFMAVFSLFFIVFKDFLPKLYIEDLEVIQIAASLLIFAAIFQIPDGIQVTALSALRGLQDVKIPTYITLVSYYVLGIPLSYIAAIHWGLGGPGVWIGLVLGLSISAFALTWRFNQLANKYLET